MKKVYSLAFCWIICSVTIAQPLPDSVKKIFNAATGDVNRGIVLMQYFDANPDKDSIFGNLLLLKQYFEDKKDPVAVDYVRLGLSRQLSRASEYAEGLNEVFELLPRFEKRKDAYGMMCCTRAFSYVYYAAGDKEKTLYYDKKTVDETFALNIPYDLAVAYNNIGSDLAEYGFFDSALYYAENAVRIAKEIKSAALISKTLSTLAETYIAKKEYDKALPLLMEVLPMASITASSDESYIYNDLSEIWLKKQIYDSAIFYARKGATLAAKINLKGQLLRGYTFLTLAYKSVGPVDSAYKYLQLSTDTKDSIFNAGKTKQLEVINVREQTRKLEAAQEKLELNNKIKMYSLLTGLGIAALIGFFLYRNSYKEKKAKILLQNKNEVIEKTLNDLKATQTQLIQSEKMASLGELTAGIAHEIQNPLNFVNNFSEVSNELIDEMKAEISKGNYEEVQLIADDVKQNLEKINHHGKRADAIVKGMLQHSRSSNGQKEPTDINALCDEYLRLSYHGLRAKDKSFNATLKTDFDKSVRKINVIPQDIGRVMMNLLTNAFYAVNEKQKSGQAALLEAGIKYEPTVSISTKTSGVNIEIKVTDNGNGIPQNIADKIFQPFFTTKPTGQGTGLGLSLSYDIIQAHGGEIKMASKQDEGTTFIILLQSS